MIDFVENFQRPQTAYGLPENWADAKDRFWLLIDHVDAPCVMNEAQMMLTYIEMYVNSEEERKARTLRWVIIERLRTMAVTHKAHDDPAVLAQWMAYVQANPSRLIPIFHDAFGHGDMPGGDETYQAITNACRALVEKYNVKVGECTTWYEWGGRVRHNAPGFATAQAASDLLASYMDTTWFWTPA